MDLKSIKKNLKSLSRTILYVYKLDPKSAALSDIAFILITAVEMVGIGVGGKFIDSTADLLLAGEVITIQEYFYTPSFQWLAIALALWIILNALNNFRRALKKKQSKNVKHQAQLDIMRKVASENLQEVEQRSFQELITFVPNYSIGRIFDTYTAFSDMMKHIITMVSAMIILSQTMGGTVFFLILIALAEPLIKFIDERKIRNFRMDEVEGIKFVDYLANIALQIRNFPELRVNGIYKYIIRAYRKEDREFINGVVHHFNRFYSDGTVFAAIGQILKYGYIIFVLFASIAQKLTIGHFKALYDYTNKVYNSTYSAVRQFTIMLDKASYTVEFFEFLDYEGFGDINVGTHKLKKGTPRIELQNLDFVYPDDPKRKVLENVNITIEPGQKVAFVGGDGSGKSSLVKTLCGLYEIIAGDYVLDDFSVRELKRGELKGKISVVFQNFVRYSISIQRNIIIASGNTKTDKKLYEKVKKISGVDKFMKKEGMTDKQILGKHFTGGKEISPGHWQRLAIARMLYRNREVFILDEPFTFLDGPGRVDLLDKIVAFAGKTRTVIYITQNTDHLEMFDVVYYIHKGKIMESGSYKELMKKHGKFYKEAMANR